MMVQLRRFVAPTLLLAAAPVLGSPTGQPNPSSNQAHIGGRDADSARVAELSRRAQAVKNAFQFAWDGYYKYAFPHDELHPVSNGFGNSRNGWGASAIDALSTAIVMQNANVVNQILAYVPKINYAVSYQDELVSLFETTIRYLGGMLSGHDFLTGPLAKLVSAQNKKNVDALLKQSVNLANDLSFAFNTPSGVPSNNLKFSTKTTDGSTTNGLATVGTLVLEWTRLADKTGNKTYAALAQKAESYILAPKPKRFVPWPGLVGDSIYLSNGSFQNANGGWTGGRDSAYEYLIKMYVYDPKRFGQYRDRWVLAADNSIKHLASHPTPRPDLTYLAEYEGRKLVNESQHLACFDGGNFILGGMTLHRQDLVSFGLQLVESCYNTYHSTLTKIGPEVFSWNNDVPADQAAFYKKNGFWIPNGSYDLRPEVIESYYYAYVATSDPKYQDWAWEGFQAIMKYCKTKSGFAALNNVNAANGGGKIDNQESFLFAELMKYSYIIQAPFQEGGVRAGDTQKYVYNTEAHPFLVYGQ